jgi:hypothetical protein
MLLSRLRRNDEGVALISVLLVGATLVALGVTALSVATTNLNDSGRDRLGGSALASSESGVAQAIELMKQLSLQDLACSTATTVCPVDPVTGTGLGNKDHPVSVQLPNGRQAQVWVETVQGYDPAAGRRVGTYKIHAVGMAGVGPGKRSLEVSVSAKPFSFPIGIFTESNANYGGNGDIVTTSMFSKACIDSRDKIVFSGTDAFYGTKAAANSTTYITAKNDNSCSDGASSSQGIHATSACNTTVPAYNDRDSQGGTISSPCQTGTGTSKFTLADLVSETGYIDKGLTPGQYAQLAAAAKAQHHYYPDPSFVWPCYFTCPTGRTPELNPVVYINGDVDKPPLDDYAWRAHASATDCSVVQPSVIMVVRNGDFTLNGGRSYTGNFFVPDGPSKGFIKGTGGGILYGTVFAYSIKLTGGAHMELHPCQVKAFSSRLLDIQVSRFHEVDR